MTRFAWLLALIAATLVPAPARAQLFDAPAISDDELGTARGGFTLPGGVEVALAALITTDVDGARLLQTRFQVDARGAIATAQAGDGPLVRIDPRGATAAATLPGLTVEHMIGQRIGSVIANAGDGRVIDHQMTVDLSIGNVQPMALGSTMFRVQALGIDAGVWRATGG